MKLSNLQKYPLFIILGLLGTVALTILSDTIGFSRTNFFPFSGPSYASWVYPVYFLISFLVFRRVLDIPKKANYYIIGAFVVLLIWSYFIFEGELFINPIPFGIDAY